MSNNHGIGKRINALRTSLGMSKSELARRCHVTTTAVWNWEENGRFPRTEALNLAADALGVSPAFLVAGADSQPPVPPATPTRSVAVIIEDARSEIATITGVPLTNVRLNVEFLSQ